MTDPVAMVRESLRASRAAGLGFDEAWSAAYGVVDGLSSSGQDAATWRAALLGTRRAWARAYLGLPQTAADRAAGALLPVFDGRGEGGAVGPRGGAIGAVLPAADGGRVA